MIYFTADWHFNHNRHFIYESRGFDSVEQMNEAIIERHNRVVNQLDTVYVLGDLCLGGADSLDRNKQLIEQMNGRLTIILGNHDTPARIEMYNQCKNVEKITYADVLKYKKYHFYLSHYPTITTNFDYYKPLCARILNLYGHTHQDTNFYDDLPFMYHVGIDSHNCEPVNINTIIADMEQCRKALLYIPF
jgi:calcineurin-like phosphoesterase family protein